MVVVTFSPEPRYPQATSPLPPFPAEGYIGELLAAGIIHPSNQVCSGSLFVPKKDKTL